MAYRYKYNPITKQLDLVESGIYDTAMWDDLFGYLVGRKLDTGSGRIDYNYFNGAVDFGNNARYPNEPVVIRHQLSHKWLIGAGAVARPHLHWKQQHASNIPNWLFGYLKVKNNGTSGIETDYSNFTLSKISSHLFSYSSGVLDQYSLFPEIDISDLGLSDFLITVLWRDTGNVSTLFAGADPSSLTELATDLDCHLKVNSLGSTSELVK